MMRHVKQKDKEKGYLPNPYRYNLRGSSLKPPLGLSPLKKMGQPDEIKEKISNLEKISKACVETIGEGFNAYWMMS
jgi:hypothetical protein